jgi:hypothetical protein
MSTLAPGGPTNSHLSITSDHPPQGESVESGVDTWRLVRYLDDHEMAFAQARCSQRVRRGFLAPEPIAGHRVGVSPAHRMLFMEGHPAVEGLAAVSDLCKAEATVLRALSDDHWPIGQDGGVSRMDQTVTLRFADPREGQVFLAGVAALDVPRCKPVIWGRPPETVYFAAELSGKTLARVYDKGLESNSAPRGQLIRLENQSRYTKEARLPVSAFDEVPAFVSNKFQRRFAPLAESAQGLTAATLPILAQRIGEKVAAGELTTRQAERIAGYLLVGQQASRSYAPATRTRRRRELRQHGFVLANPLSDPLEVDLGAALDEALAAWSRDA